MYNDAMDMFREMDEIFSHLFSRGNARQNNPWMITLREDETGMVRETDEIFDHLFPGLADDFTYGSCAPAATTGFRYCESPESSGCVTPTKYERTGGEPVPEIVSDRNGVTIAVELPGVTDENLNLAVRGGNLIIEAVLENRVYSTRAMLPTGTDQATMQHSLKNGVLEVRFASSVNSPDKK